MSSADNKAIVARFIAAVNDRDYEAFDGLLTNDFSIPPDAPQGLSKEALISVLKYYVAAFPDLHYAPASGLRRRHSREPSADDRNAPR
jgi:hypothetical protein